MLRRIDAERLLEDPEARVARDVEREQRGWVNAPSPTDPDQRARQREVPDQLVEEGRMKGRVVRVAIRPVRRVDLESPGQVRRPTEELLVEVVADTTDRLRDEQGRCGGVEEGRYVCPASAQDPEGGGRAARDAAAG